ncbi:MAG: adenylate/guanylate cyclase domain-containing protein [Mycolicibacterium sp.]|nr:adenylate/guanylate cyclase domain-containing protein [Mycolicibacterium sp.]
MDVEASGRPTGPANPLEADSPEPGRGPGAWIRNTNHNPGVVAAIRKARRALPGDPDFGDPLSTSGQGSARAAARAADRFIGDRAAATREVSLAGLQVWQALAEKVAGRPVNAEVTIVFTDLVGFSDWSLQAGDEATLRLLRRVAQVAEPPMLYAGGHIVKRMGDGMMATFGEPAIAVRATLAAMEALDSVEVEGYTPRMRAGVHTGRPQRIGGDWLGVDVNIAARVMDRAAHGGLIVSQATLGRITPDQWEPLGVRAEKVRRQVFTPRQPGVPADLVMFRLRRGADEIRGENVAGSSGAEGSSHSV